MNSKTVHRFTLNSPSEHLASTLFQMLFSRLYPPGVIKSPAETGLAKFPFTLIPKFSCPLLPAVAENEIVAGYNTCPGSVVNVKLLAVTELTCTATFWVTVVGIPSGLGGMRIVLTSLMLIVEPNATVPLNCTDAEAAGTPRGPKVPE